MGIKTALLTTIIAAVTVSTCQDASARIGETHNECKQRYKPHSSQGAKEHFTKNGMRIIIIFVDDKCEKITYTRDYREKVKTFARETAYKLIDINGGGRKWKKANESKTMFKTNQRVATLTLTDGEVTAITISTNAMAAKDKKSSNKAAEKVANKSTAAEKLDGF